MIALVITAAVGVCGFASIAQAQTAHFTGTVSTLGSGFGFPSGVAVDKNGNVYVADSGNNAVKEILAVNGSIPSSNPTINTLGSGFNAPYGVAVDKSGNVYVADTFNNVVKEILAVNGSIPSNPTINTLGSGFSYPSGVAVDASGNVYVSNFGNSTVQEILAVDGSIPASSPTINTLGSGFSNPGGVAVDASGNVYVADARNSAIKEMLAVSGSVPANPTINILGSGFNFPFGVAVDESGNVFVADSGNNAVKEILAVNGSIPSSNPTINTLGSGFSTPEGIAVDGEENVYVADTNNNVAKEIMTQGVNLGAVALGSTSSTVTLTFSFDTDGTTGAPEVLTQGAPNLDFTAATSQLSNACAAATYNAGDTCTLNVIFTPTHPGLRAGALVLLSSTGAPIATVYIYGIGTGPQAAFLPGTINTVAGSGNYGYNGTPVTAISANLRGPAAVAVDGAGDIFIADWFHRVIAEVNSTTGVLSTVVNTSTAACSNPTASPACGNGGPATSATLSANVQGVAVDGAGNYYIADTGDNAIRKVDATGTITTVAGDGTAGYTGDGSTATSAELDSPYGIAVDGAGNLYIADTGNKVIRKVNTYGIISTVVGGGTPCGSATDAYGDGCAATDATLSNATALALDSAGDIYIVDGGAASTSNNLIRRVDAVTGIITAIAGNGTAGYRSGDDGGLATNAELNEPQGIAVDPAGNLYIADTNNDRVRKVDAATQIITTIAGNGTPCSTNTTSAPTTTPACGDTGPATSALVGPVGMALDSAGNLYITDFNANRVRMVGTTPVPIAFATATDVGVADATDDPQIFALSNIGNEPLNFPVPAEGNDPTMPSGFSLDSATTCPQISASSSSAGTLAAGAACKYAVDFVPSAGGVNSGSLQLVDNTLNAAGPNYATQSVALSGTGIALTPTITFAPNPATQVYGTTITAGSLDAAAAYNSNTVAGTFAYTTTVNASQQTLAAGTTVLPVGSYTVTAAFTPSNASVYLTASGMANYSVTQAGTVTTLSVSSSTVAPGQSEILSAQVASATSGTPAGTVSFYDGTSLLSTVTLSAGVATFSTSALSPGGTHTLTASYSGDTNFTASSTSSSTTVTVSPLGFTLTLSGGQADTIAQGGAASYGFAIAPTYGTYPGAVTFAASGLPTGATATFSPATLAATSGAQTVTLTIQTAAATAMQQAPSVGSRMVPATLALLFLPLFGTGKMRKRGRRLRHLVCLALVLGGIAAASLVGCGGQRTSQAQTPTAYQVAVSATSNGEQHSATVTLNVQ